MQKIWNGNYFQAITYFLIMTCNCRLKIVFFWEFDFWQDPDHRTTKTQVGKSSGLDV